MRKTSIGRRLALAGTTGVAALIATLGVGVGTATAAPTDPPQGVAPSFNNGVVNAIRSSGSDTTFFMMQKIGDLYTSAGLYGCILNAGTLGESLYNSAFTSSGNAESYCVSGGNIDTTDTADNWNRTEVYTGVDDVGSTAGQQQLCGNSVLHSPLTVDFARSSKPAGTYCTGLASTGYAKDAVPAVDFPAVNPSTFGTVASTSPYFSVNGGNIGPVAAGWIPGDPLAGPYTGTPLTKLYNNDNGGAAGATAYRLYCATDSTRITDWGNLTNLSASGPGNGGVAKTVGNGAPIGIPIRIMGVNPASGTEATFTSFINGTAPTTCGTTNGNAANDPNPATAPTPNAIHVSLENNTSQTGDFAVSDFPGDVASQAVEVASTIYYASNGVLNTVPYSGSVTVGTKTITASKVQLNGVTPNTGTILGNTYPTARTLWNIYDTNTVRASTGGFLNWICDSNTAILKQKDNSTGANFDTELGSIIGSFGFIRLTDTSSVPAQSTPADGIAAPNTTCASGLNGGGTAGNGTPAVTAVGSANT